LDQSLFGVDAGPSPASPPWLDGREYKRAPSSTRGLLGLSSVHASAARDRSDRTIMITGIGDVIT
jgi:hypothetical protein